MCGIAGIARLGRDRAPLVPDPKVPVTAMVQAMKHRGPDAEGVWGDANVALGQRRLSIIDLSTESDQPFHSTDGRFVMTFNGEIYNYRELRKELEAAGEVFRTASDTEVLLAGYARWGEDVLHRLKGMFAFAIVDRASGEVFIARDRLGIKPLYVHQNEQRIVFASELRAVLASGLVPRRLDRTALADYLRYQTVHAPATIVQGVRMLMPGHWIRVREGALTTACWWNMSERADRSAGELSIERVRSEVRERLLRAVERRLVSDVPFGAFLSGGIDSSAIVGLMSEVSSGAVHTFSVGFDEEEFSEERYALIVAKKFGTVHTPIRLRADEMLRSLPDVLAAMDHPSGDGPNTYVVSRATKQAGITMALSGLGSDEIFAGYPVFTRTMALQRFSWLAKMPFALRRAGAAAITRLKYPAGYHKIANVMQLGSVAVESTYPVSRLVAPEQKLAALLADRTLAPDRVGAILHELMHAQRGDHLPLFSQVSLAELSTYLQNVLLRDTDQMSMAHALEVRVPFLDHDLVEFVLGVNDAHKFPHTPKKLLTDSLGDLLPPEIINRPKMGFTLPWGRWMREDLKTFCEQRIVRLGERAEFDADGLTGLWERFASGDQRISWARLWYLVVLSDWLDRHGIES